ncbi:unnamed protein product [Calypogeia fissa]
MGVMMVRAGGINEWVIITHRHRIFVLALLQSLILTSFTSNVSGARSHFDTAIELQRSMARYRHLLESENSKNDTKIQLDEKVTTEKVEDELNLANLDQPQQEVGLEKDLGQESKKVDELQSPTEPNSNETDRLGAQQQGAGLENGDQEQELGTREQPQDEAREGAKEGNATNLGTFVFPDPYLLGPTIKDWDEQRSSWLEQNPHMKSTLTKPRVLMVTGSQPKPCVSPVGDHFHVRSFKLKVDYARIHGFEIYYNLVWLDPLFGGWWAKLPTLRKLMLTHPEIEWFFWVDSDAVFTDMLFEPPFHTYEGYNTVMWGWEDGLFTKKSWVAFNAGVFFIRNCQWSLDLVDKWSPMGPEGPVRDEYGKIFTSFLSFRKDNFSSDDQSALAYLMITDEAVRSKVKLVESDIYTMSGFWIEVVETYEDCAEKYHPGLGDKRWPWVTHFTGCGFCAGGDNPDYAYERCMETFGRAYNFADNQVLAYVGFEHKNLSSDVILPTRHDTDRPIEFVGVNPWEERIAQEAGAGAAAKGTSS